MLTKLTKLPKTRNLWFEFLYKRWISSSYEAQKPRRVAAVWGNGDYGRLGLGSLESQWRPVNISSFGDQSVCQIACGGAHTLFLTGCEIVLFLVCLNLFSISCCDYVLRLITGLDCAWYVWLNYVVPDWLVMLPIGK